MIYDSYQVHEALDRTHIISVMEALDRTHIISVMLEAFLRDHPVIMDNPECFKRVDKAAKHLGKLYQLIGNLPCDIDLSEENDEDA